MVSREPSERRTQLYQPYGHPGLEEGQHHDSGWPRLHCGQWRRVLAPPSSLAAQCSWHSALPGTRQSSCIYRSFYLSVCSSGTRRWGGRKQEATAEEIDADAERLRDWALPVSEAPACLVALLSSGGENRGSGCTRDLVVQGIWGV